MLEGFPAVLTPDLLWAFRGHEPRRHPGRDRPRLSHARKAFAVVLTDEARSYACFVITGASVV